MFFEFGSAKFILSLSEFADSNRRVSLLARAISFPHVEIIQGLSLLIQFILIKVEFWRRKTYAFDLQLRHSDSLSVEFARVRAQYWHLEMSTSRTAFESVFSGNSGHLKIFACHVVPPP